MNYKIAVLLTCHNRVSKTLSSLKYLFEASDKVISCCKIKIFLTDDGSIDNTSSEVLKHYGDRNIVILQGNGNLFWAGGIRLSWIEAQKEYFDGYLLINDDTKVFSFLFEDLLATHLYSLKTYNKPGIYIGTTKSENNEITYGGIKILNKLKVTGTRVIPNGLQPLGCDWGNANIMFVPKEVVELNGILSSRYKHGIADFDFTLSAKKKKIPVLVTPNVCGICENDHVFDFNKFIKMKMVERIQFTWSPKGYALQEYLIYNMRHFIYRVPFVFLAALLKILIPSIYLILNKKFR